MVAERWIRAAAYSPRPRESTLSPPTPDSERRPDWRRIALVFGPLLVVLLTILVFPSPWLTRVATWLHHAEEPAPADVIVVLGGDSVNRMITGMDLHVAGLAHRLAFTVPDTATERASMTNIEKWRYLLGTRGIPLETADVLAPSTSTYSDAFLIRNYALQNGFTRVLVVTDPYHTRRSGWIIRRALSGTNVDVSVVAASNERFHPERWWKDEDQLLWVSLEYLKFLYYVASYGFRGPLEGPAGALHEQPAS